VNFALCIPVVAVHNAADAEGSTTFRVIVDCFFSFQHKFQYPYVLLILECPKTLQSMIILLLVGLEATPASLHLHKFIKTIPFVSHHSQSIGAAVVSATMRPSLRHCHSR
jgi:hypothetical protein